MARNQRVYYAIKGVGIAPNSTTTFTAVHGLQSMGMNTKFNLEQIFEFGQLAIYQNAEALPDIEITMEKVLDGYPLIGHLATYGAPDASLAGRSNQRCMVALSIFGDTQQAASGTPISQCTSSGMFLQNWGFNFSTDGNFTESCTLVGNNKTWATGTGYTFTGGFTNTDIPSAPEGVNRRQNFLMPSCVFPLDIPGISSSGTNDLNSDGFYNVHFLSIKPSTNLGREQLLELGRKGPYFRYVQFPVQVTCDFDLTAIQGDLVSATEAGIYSYQQNTRTGSIYLQTQEGTKVNLGTQNRLSSVNFTGGNAGTQGGNTTATYSFITFNDFKILHPADPSPGLAA